MVSTTVSTRALCALVLSALTPAVLAQTASPGVGDYDLVGCYAEPDGARALPSVYLNENQTVETCVAQAMTAGATYASLEYGQECWYGSHVHSGSRPKPLSECNFACPGNNTEFCGAGNRFLLYSVDGVVPPVDSDVPTQPATVGGYEFSSCVTEGDGIRALTGDSMVSDTMTLESCATYCAAYTYFGVEYSRECYCGNSFNNGSVPVAGTDCSMVCSGNGLQYCGAGNRLSAYAKISA